MKNIHTRKRIAHKRRVQTALQEILNDETVMPNADGRDLMVSVSRVEFGRTVRQIFIDVVGQSRSSDLINARSSHETYLQEAVSRGEETYIDLTDMFHFPDLTDIIARKLQQRLGLLYIPVIRRFSDMGSL